jgi:electron transport complex protein RnfE
LFSGLDLAFGPGAKQFILTVIPDYHGFLLAVLPPGAFLGLGGLIALRNWIEMRKAAKQSAGMTSPLSVVSH